MGGVNVVVAKGGGINGVVVVYIPVCSQEQTIENIILATPANTRIEAVESKITAAAQQAGFRRNEKRRNGTYKQREN